MKKILLTAACMLLMSGAAMAQDDSQSPVPAQQHGQFQGREGHEGRGMTKAQFMEKAQERAAQMFDRADANHDGVVTREEMKAARGAMKGERGERRGRGGEGGGNEGGNQFP